MGIIRGTNVTRNNLIFGYDTGYGIADKNTSTRFYPGRPTTNEVNFSTHDLDSWTSYTNGNDGTFTTEFGTLGLKINNRVSWNGAYRAFTLPSTGTYTFSGWFRYRGGTSNNNGATVYISSYGGSDTATGLDKSKIGEWQRVTKTVNVTDVTVMFYFISYGGTQSGGSPDKSSWDVTMPQIEKLSDETPFVNGSRSNTTSLIDLTKTTDLDVSNVSFNSAGLPEFDGTNDFINVPTNFGSMNKYSFEWVENAGSTHRMPIAGRTNTNFYKYGAYSWRYKHGGTLGEFYHTTGATSGWHHWVVTYDGSNIKVYQDAGSLGTSSSSGSADFSDGLKVGYWSAGGNYAFNGPIPVMRFYDNALTAEEVKNNFKAYKNRFNI